MFINYSHSKQIPRLEISYQFKMTSNVLNSLVFLLDDERSSYILHFNKCEQVMKHKHSITILLYSRLLYLLWKPRVLHEIVLDIQYLFVILFCLLIGNICSSGKSIISCAVHLRRNAPTLLSKLPINLFFSLIKMLICRLM